MTVPLIAPQQGTIGLPAERLAQLREIAKARGTTIVGIVEAAIAQAVEDGEIPDELPGLASVVPDDDILCLTIRGAPLPFLTREKAMVISTVLEAAAGVVHGDLGFSIKVGKGTAVDLGSGVKLMIGRHAKAVLISIVDAKTGEPRMKTATTPSLALDLAQIIRKHAKTLMPTLDEAERRRFEVICS
ncbi:hypothetical protein [Methylobacterium oryzisoli]|uniref:hypothetical protein n=1 Tax=Methylobacterium oryzisoli TaxID=3385502 RepID=UPI003979FB35